MRYNSFFILGLVLTACLFTTNARAEIPVPVDYTIYADLLSRHVEGGVVSYAGFKKDEARLGQFLDVLAKVEPDRLERDDLMAFYINAYNAWTIKLILSEYPGIKSIRDIGGIFTNPWKQEIVRIGGKKLHLDNLEHDILRPEFKDARVHFAVNCASKSCPPLISGALLPGPSCKTSFRPIRSLLSITRTTIYLAGNKLFVSRIFKWFSEDFNGGRIVSFILQYAQGGFKQRLQAMSSEVEIEYLDYDWSLNGG